MPPASTLPWDRTQDRGLPRAGVTPSWVTRHAAASMIGRDQQAPAPEHGRVRRAALRPGPIQCRIEDRPGFPAIRVTAPGTRAARSERQQRPQATHPPSVSQSVLRSTRPRAGGTVSARPAPCGAGSTNARNAGQPQLVAYARGCTSPAKPRTKQRDPKRGIIQVEPGGKTGRRPATSEPGRNVKAPARQRLGRDQVELARLSPVHRRPTPRAVTARAVAAAHRATCPPASQWISSGASTRAARIDCCLP